MTGYSMTGYAMAGYAKHSPFRFSISIFPTICQGEGRVHPTVLHYLL